MLVRHVTFRENALFENAQSIIFKLGTHPVYYGDSVVYDIVGKRFEEYLGQNGLVLPVFFNGEASDNEINRMVSLAEENGCDLVIGLGVGGKTIDSAKAIADLLKSPVVIAPTIAL